MKFMKISSVQISWKVTLFMAAVLLPLADASAITKTGHRNAVDSVKRWACPKTPRSPIPASSSSPPPRGMSSGRASRRSSPSNSSTIRTSPSAAKASRNYSLRLRPEIPATSGARRCSGPGRRTPAAIEVDIAPKKFQNITVKPNVPERLGGYGMVVDLGPSGRSFVTSFVRTFKPGSHGDPLPADHQRRDRRGRAFPAGSLPQPPGLRLPAYHRCRFRQVVCGAMRTA